MNIMTIRDSFPLLNKKINGKSITYLDSAATSQMPDCVLNKFEEFYYNSYANVHRSVDTLGYLATSAYEDVRNKTAAFINAQSSQEVIFTSGCTDSLNLIAATYGEENIHEGDEIVVTIMEHHSNLLPWQQLAKRKKAVLKYIYLSEQQDLDLEDAKRKISSKTKIVALAQCSNVLGCVNPVKEIADLAHKYDAVVVVDGAQAVGHFKVDVQALNADFYAFSGHKMFAPNGVGVLYGKKDLLEKMRPYRYGGEMISQVTEQNATWAELPQKFEAGTPNIAGVIGLGAAISFVNSVGLAEIYKHEQGLVNYLLSKFANLDYITIYGPKDNHTGVIAFNVADLHPHDVATFLDQQGVEVRAGHHCAQPLMNYLGVESTIRASFSIYNNEHDIDQLIQAIKTTKEFFDGIK